MTMTLHACMAGTMYINVNLNSGLVSMTVESSHTSYYIILNSIAPSLCTIFQVIMSCHEMITNCGHVTRA